MQRIYSLLPRAALVAFVITMLGLCAGQSISTHSSSAITNEKATAAISGDAAVISALADDVLQGSPILRQLSTIDPTLKNTLVSAEISYRAKQHPGIRDASVAAAINTLAHKIGAPLFAYTDCAEVRRLRMKMMPLVPALFARDLKRPDGKGGFHIRETMSPREAVYLFASIIDQKLWNPDFQLTSKERREKWVELHSRRQPGVIQANARTKELFSAFEATATKQSMRDLALFGSDVLARLLASQSSEGGK